MPEDFDPDAYLASRGSDFDPDAYLASKGAPVAPQEPWLEAGPLKIQNNPMNVNWGDAAAKSFGSEFFSGDGTTNSLSMDANPLIGMSVAPEAVGPAAAGVISSTASRVGSFIKNGAERFATSPLPQKVANAASKLDAGGGFMGKFMSYANPFTAPVQGAVDATKAVPLAQKGVAWALDNAPQKLGKFAPVLQKAAQSGASALATTDFILTQQHPELQELKKRMHEQ